MTASGALLASQRPALLSSLTHFDAAAPKMSSDERGERLQIMLSQEELRALEDWRFAKRMPSRAAAVRELLRRGLAAEGFDLAGEGIQSKQFGIVDKGGADASTAEDGN